MKTTVSLVLLLIVMNASGEERTRSLVMNDPPRYPVTGNLRVDLFSRTTLADAPDVSPQGEPSDRPHKSPYIAAGLSLAVPGAGEFYTHHYWEAVAFFAADVAAWVLAYHYDHKGDTQTDFFQNYANAHWSVVQYGLFSIQYIPVSERDNYHWLKPGTEGLPPWERVNWDVLNQMERQVSATPNGQYYSHNLPPYGDQQYYELIGKYQQFYQGWDDRDTLLTTYDQIRQRLLSSPQAHMIYYSIERGKANDYYSSASTWVAVAIINHVVNAAYAALSAGWYNSAHAELGLQRVPTEGGFTNVPVVKMRWAF